MSDDTPTGQTRRRRTPVSDSELVDAVLRCTPAGTTEVADIVGVSRQAATYRLENLEEGDAPIWSKKVGPTRVWLHERAITRGFAP